MQVNAFITLMFRHHSPAAWEIQWQKAAGKRFSFTKKFPSSRASSLYNLRWQRKAA
jgi:hypothetical protein